MKKSKVLVTFLSLLLISCLTLALAACNFNNDKDNPSSVHTHSWSETLTFDANNHWYACSGCSEKQNSALHKTITKADENVIWHECKVCDYVSNKNPFTLSMDFDATENNSSYTINSNQVVQGSNLIIPSFYKDKPVTSIQSEAFINSASLTSVVIPSTITNIGEKAFANCLNLKNVTIGDNELNIQKESSYENSSSFYANTYDDYNSSEVIDNLAEICDYAFDGCTNLESVVIGNSVSVIGRCAFRNCTKLSNVIFGENIKYICSQAFECCTAIKDITIPDSLTEIHEGAFNQCNIENATVPDIAAYEVKNDNLKSIVITSGNNMIVAWCDSLEKVTILNGVTSIHEYAFEDCINLTSVTIPDSVTSIGYSAFEGCNKLPNIIIPDNVTSIGYSAFKGCSGLTSITIPNGVSSIEKSTFEGCSGLTSIVIPDSVSSICNSAFKNCNGLTSLTIPNSVISIEDYAFYGCNELTNITLGTSLTSIGYRAFSPENLLNIYYTGDLKSWCENEIENISDLLFGNTTSKNLFIDGKEITGELVIPKGVTKIGIAKFASTKITSIIIPDSVTSIGEKAFHHCSNLTNIVIPDSVTEISFGLLLGCINLTSINISKNITKIGGSAFLNCYKLETINYSGTMEDFKNIEKGFAWNPDNNNTKIICTDGIIDLS